MDIIIAQKQKNDSTMSGSVRDGGEFDERVNLWIRHEHMDNKPLKNVDSS